MVFSVAIPHAIAADPYVVYTANNEADGAVILRSEPATGSTIEISRNGSAGTLFQHPYDLAVEADGSLVVADMGVRNQKDGAVIRVDPITGRQSVVSSGGAFYDPSGIAIGPGGVLYVLDNLAGANSGAVIRVDPDTGHQDLISSDFNPLALFDLPFGIAVDADGSLVVVNRALAGQLPLQCLLATGSVIRIDPSDGSQSLISALGRLSRPARPDDRLRRERRRRERVRLSQRCGTCTGEPRRAADRPHHQQRRRLPADARARGQTPAGELLVTDYSLGADGDGGIVKVNPSTGAQSVVSTDNLFNHPLGVAVVANRPPTAALAVKPGLVAAGRQVNLDASGSRDPEGLRLVYEWDLDGNGTFEVGSGTTPTAMPKFAVDGATFVRVRVNDPHGGRAVAEGTVNVDASRPVLTGLRTLARVLALPSRRGRGHASSATPPPATTLRFRVSEAARVTVALNRARKGRRSKGACSTRAKRGRRCTAWSTARTIRRTATAGQNDITLRARGLRTGRYRVVLTATDEVGNRSPRRTLGLHVVRLHR